MQKLKKLHSQYMAVCEKAYKKRRAFQSWEEKWRRDKVKPLVKSLTVESIKQALPPDVFQLWLEQPNDPTERLYWDSVYDYPSRQLMHSLDFKTCVPHKGFWLAVIDELVHLEEGKNSTLRQLRKGYDE